MIEGLGMLKNLPGVLQRSKDSRDCIDAKKRAGKTGREARQECREVYGSRLGNAGRSLGILPQEAKGLNVSQIAQAVARQNTPSRFGMTNEQIVLPGGGGSTGNGVAKGSFNPLLLLGLVFFIPGVRKFIGF
tara:strand:- start:329 stop:724 length:396 start_codon:yes stop_codon:yes gene_type:complete